ncbi:hypothetical protein [uncultured Microbacterium sp.]|uniref:hypothetical protein n=1 Tax=uncultured Microbacterium sp. TaxID=191216 RepID=UPI0028EF882A|nr:hypothetical protein [uncultured Microbacterium sp.]
MPVSFEDFRSTLPHAPARDAWGLVLTDAEAQQVAADEQASRAWYDYFLATTATAPTAPAAAAPLGGHELPVAAAPGFAAAPPPAPVAAPWAPTPAESPERKSRVGLWVTLGIVGALLLIAAIVTVFAFATARHWTKIDVPEKPETFHSEEYETGKYLVADDGVSPCAVDQDWTDCIGLMEAEYAGACAGVDLVPASADLCAQHRTEIDRMIAEDADGMYVASLGDFGHLTRTPETATRQVSNDDAEPAVTHEAVCYLGFLGECE